jgi:hypothetical protein
MASNKRLIGEDGYMAKGVLGTKGLTIPAKTWALITNKKTTGSAFGALSIGDFYYNPLATALTLTTTDEAQPLTLTKLIDGVGWNLDLSADEIDVTVNADTVKKYRRGKADATGNVSFLYIQGVSDIAGGLANKFFDICEISATGVATVSTRDAGSIYLVGYLNAGNASDVEDNVASATIMRVEFFSFSLPSKMGEPGNMDVPFRLAGEGNPILYRIALS